MNINIRELEYFLAVVEEGNLTKAADKLYIAQPSLSQAIKKLEQELGTNLFIRIKKRLKLTPEGEQFVEASKHIIQIIKKLENNILDSSNLKKGRLVVGFPYHLGSFIMPRVLTSYKKLYPGIDIQILESTSTELENMILEGILDIAIVPLPFKNVSLHYRPFYSSRMVLIMSKDHPLNAYAYTKDSGNDHMYFNLSNANKVSFIIGKQGQRIRTISELIFQKAQISPKIVLTSKNIETIIRIVATGLGMTLVPEHYLQYMNIDKKANFYYLEPGQDYTWTVASAFYNENDLSFASNKFISLLEQIYA